MIRIVRPYISFIVDLDYTVPALEEKRDWKTRVIDKILQIGYLSEIKGGGGNVISIKLVPKGSHNQISDKELMFELKRILEEERIEKKLQPRMKTGYNIYRRIGYTIVLEPGYNEYKTREKALKAIENKGKAYIHDLIIIECTRKNTNLE